MSNLVTPLTLRDHYPLSPRCSETIARARHELIQILDNQDPRPVVLIGPCSIHNAEEALAYSEKLKTQIEKYQDSLCIIMRVYFEKARTALGWKGLISDPFLNNAFNIEEGLRLSRSLLCEINNMGVPCASEIINPFVEPYFSDLLSTAIIGARTTESQIHRELASYLPMPMGFKNNTSGDIQVAIDAVQVARYPHHFLHINHDGNTTVAQSAGNAHGYVILRGSHDETNYNAGTIQKTVNLLNEKHLNSRVMIDCSHGNSQKNHEQQSAVITSLLPLLSSKNSPVFGVMIESYLNAGKQQWHPHCALEYGKSITDACIGWDETENVLAQLSEAALKKRETVLN